MGESSAKVHISLRDGILEIEGSEKFVSEQLGVLRPIIEEAVKQPSPALTANPLPPNPTGAPSGQSGLGAYENLFAEADGKVQILKTLPGSNKAQKSINGALLLAYANTLMGNESTPFKDVRDLCSSHACLDSSNFSSTMKGHKELFLVSGSGSSQMIRLTVPGKKKAEELANQLN